MIKEAVNTKGNSQIKLIIDEEENVDLKTSKTGELLTPKKRSKKYLIKEEIKIKKLTLGSYFGELAILSKLKRTASVKAEDYCTLSSLS